MVGALSKEWRSPSVELVPILTGTVCCSSRLCIVVRTSVSGQGGDA